MVELPWTTFFILILAAGGLGMFIGSMVVGMYARKHMLDMAAKAEELADKLEAMGNRSRSS